MRITPSVIVQGHRGARGVLPENTLASFAHAIAAGVDRIEIDLNVTADGTLVVVHDESTHPDLVRGADGRWLNGRAAWHALALEEVRTYDVGRIRPDSFYAARFPEQRPADGQRVPLFDEVAALVLADGACGINIEIKCDPDGPEPRPAPGYLAELAVAAIHRHGLAERVTVQSFNWQVVAAVRSLDGTLSTGCESSEVPGFDTIGRAGGRASPWTNGLSIADFDGSVPAMVASMGVDYWASEYRDLDQARIDEAHVLGLEVHCWTVNDPEDMNKLISWGVDSIITDYPEKLLALVRDRDGG